VFFTPLFARIGYGRPITRETWIGGSPGILGVALCFAPDLLAVGPAKIALWGVGAMLIAAIVSSIASVLSMRLNELKVPVFTYTAWAMLYGALVTFLWGALTGQAFVIDTRVSFWIAFLYLSVAGTLITFLCYLVLLRREGPARTMYIGVLAPVGALLVSVALEGLRPALLTWLGIAIALVGAWFTLAKKVPEKSA
jgi:drug/metabolite transporter (DMT)-like permease